MKNYQIPQIIYIGTVCVILAKNVTEMPFIAPPHLPEEPPTASVVTLTTTVPVFSEQYVPSGLYWQV